MEADWTRLQPPAQDQHRPARKRPRPAAITTGKAVRGHKNSRFCAGLEIVGGCNPGSGFTLREQGRRWSFDCQSMNSALDICQVATYTQ